MATAIAPAESRAIVFDRDGDIFTDSRTVADHFEKKHKDVLRAIDALIEQEPSLRGRSFAPTLAFVPMPRGGQRKERRFDMDRRGFALLAMGFTGAAALKWKLRFMDAFDMMERELQKPLSTGTAFDPNDPSQLRSLLIDYSERTIALQGRVTVLEPKAAAHDRIADSSGTLCITDAAKTLGLRPKDLFVYLRRNRWLYRRPRSRHDRTFEEKRKAGLLEHKMTEPDTDGRTFQQVRITPRGLAQLAELLAHPAPASIELKEFQHALL